MPDESNNRQYFVNEWIKHAEDDELNARAILRNRDGTPAQVCFLSQQLAEKSLKALLLHYTGDYPKIHDLRELFILLGFHAGSIPQTLNEDAAFLNPFYAGTRYPADIPIESFTWERSETAFAASQRIKEFVLELLKFIKI